LTVLGVVPARYASTRLEGKVLCDIGGKPMIQHVWERAMKAELLDEVIVAVDDARVYQVANGFGARAVMTSDEHVCGTERVEEAARSSTAKIVVNIQGDEPFIPPGMIDETVQPLLDDPGLQMATVMRRITSEEELADPGVVKTVTDRDGFALYFSRSLIPHPRQREHFQAFEHLGIYSYRREFLTDFVRMEPGPLEQTEGLEMLRALEHGARIRVVPTRHRYEALSVDTLEDLRQARKIYSKMEHGGRDEG
jgi:3-deoxy-manno-octulosonate cytidylyltransferase (CMP-KDO synthetase)